MSLRGREGMRTSYNALRNEDDAQSRIVDHLYARHGGDVPEGDNETWTVAEVRGHHSDLHKDLGAEAHGDA